MLPAMRQNLDGQIIMFPVQEVKQEKSVCRFRKAVPDGVHPVDRAAEVRHQKKTTDALKSVDEINQFIEFLLNRNQYRDALFCVIGCNSGLRASDILWMRWKDIFKDGDGERSPKREMICQKTGKYIEYIVNDAVLEMAELYRSHASIYRECEQEDWIFHSEGPRTGYTSMWDRSKSIKSKRIEESPQPMLSRSMSRIITKAAKESGLFEKDRRISTHSFRKTGLNALAGGVAGIQLDEELLYQAKMIEAAKMMAGHSTSATTVNHYLTDEFRIAACTKMNLGLQAIKKFKKGG